MVKVKNGMGQGVRWTFTSVLEDLDYADNVALISSRFADLLEKPDRLVATTDVVGIAKQRRLG